MDLMDLQFHLIRVAAFDIQWFDYEGEQLNICHPRVTHNKIELTAQRHEAEWECTDTQKKMSLFGLLGVTDTERWLS